MTLPKNVCYRVAAGPCQNGWIDTADCSALTPVVFAAGGTTPVAGAVITPCADCPAEVVIVGAGAAAPPPLPTYDREKALLCDPDGAAVLAVTIWSDQAAPGTAPVVEYYDQAGAAWAGDPTTLTQCVRAEQLDVGAAEFFCDDGKTLSRTSFWNITTSPPTLVFNEWQDSSGATVAPPTAATSGACGAVVTQLAYAHRNGGVVTMADIVADVGGCLVQSVTVTQMAGTGTLTADFGGGFPLYAGETRTFSVFSESTTDSLNTSTLAFDAGGGEQHITAIVVCP